MIEKRSGEGEDSDWNTAKACGFRLHNLLVESNSYSRALQFIPWRLTLDTIYREIDAVLSDAERKVCEDTRAKVDAACNLYIKEQGNNQWPTGTIANRQFAPTYRALHEFEKQLRRCAGKHGLLFKKSEDKRLALTK